MDNKKFSTEDLENVNGGVNIKKTKTDMYSGYPVYILPEAGCAACGNSHATIVVADTYTDDAGDTYDVYHCRTCGEHYKVKK
ncbi:MAG: hypothetical protein K6F99_07075 [Lachnospiraceae bacterium]|nr:hypothetical protein [Lachnospiraceae bacterium]